MSPTPLLDQIRIYSESLVEGLPDSFRTRLDLQDDGSLPSSFSCEYVAPEPAPVGFGNTDPANNPW